MSNQENVNVDELELEVNEQDSVVDNAPDEEEEQLKAHKEKVWNGMIDSEILKISKGEKKFEDLDSAMRKAVESKMAIKPESKVVDNTELITTRVKEELILDSLLETVEENQREEVKNDYKIFVGSGLTSAQAREKVRKLHGIKTREELTEHGERFISTGSVQKAVKKESYSAAEQKFLKAMGAI